MLAGLLAVALLFLAYVYQHGRSLELRVAELTAELSASQHALQVSRGQMDVVRGHIDDLFLRVDALREAVADQAGQAAR